MSRPAPEQRPTSGARSARTVLFTVLGEFVLPAGGALWTSTAIDVLGRLGVEEKATRQALMRIAADAWLTAERDGRRARWRLTPKARRLLQEGTRRIYGFGAASAGWDGRLLLVLARVPETDRSARHLLRTRLGWAGFGAAGPGVWIGAHTERAAEIEQLLADAAVPDARIFEVTHRGGADLASMVAQAWDLNVIDERYRSFLREFAAARTADPLSRLVELVDAWRRFPSLDPELPGELLPAAWSGRRAAALFANRHARWAADATAEWARLESC